MAPDNRRERQREGSGSQAGEGTPPAAWLPGPGPGSPPSVSLQTSGSKGVSLGAQSLCGVTPAAEAGLGKNLLGKVPEPLFTSRDRCWEGGQSPYATARLGAPEGSWGAPPIFLDLQERQIWGDGMHCKPEIMKVLPETWTNHFYSTVSERKFFLKHTTRPRSHKGNDR